MIEHRALSVLGLRRKARQTDQVGISRKRTTEAILSKRRNIGSNYILYIICLYRWVSFNGVVQLIHLTQGYNRILSRDLIWHPSSRMKIPKLLYRLVP